MRFRQEKRDKYSSTLRNERQVWEIIYLEAEKKKKRVRGGIKCCCTWKAAATSVCP